jgi:hypothetical protein
MTIVCREGAAPIDAIAAEHDWAVFQTLGKLDFHLVGILAELTSVLAEANVPILAFSSYTSDLILVKGHHLREASEALESAGHQIIFR